MDTKRKKSEKKLAKVQEIEDSCESEKSAWKSFNKKMKKQGKFRMPSKSIFASPETGDGKVGVGTCGSSGRRMTQFNIRRNHLNTQ